MTAHTQIVDPETAYGLRMMAVARAENAAAFGGPKSAAAKRFYSPEVIRAAIKPQAPSGTRLVKALAFLEANPGWQPGPAVSRAAGVSSGGIWSSMESAVARGEVIAGMNGRFRYFRHPCHPDPGPMPTPRPTISRNRQMALDGLRAGPATATELAKRVGRSRDVVKEALGWLRVRGYVTIGGVPGQNNRVWSVAE